MLGIKKSRDHVKYSKSMSFYLTVPLSECLFVRRLKFTITISACRQKNPPTILSFMNQGSDNLFNHEHQGRNISIKFRHKFYNLVRKLQPQKISKMTMKTSESNQLFFRLRRKILLLDLLSQYDDDYEEDLYKNLYKKLIALSLQR